MLKFKMLMHRKAAKTKQKCNLYNNIKFNFTNRNFFGRNTMTNCDLAKKYRPFSQLCPNMRFSFSFAIITVLSQPNFVGPRFCFEDPS